MEIGEDMNVYLTVLPPALFYKKNYLRAVTKQLEKGNVFFKLCIEKSDCLDP